MIAAVVLLLAYVTVVYAATCDSSLFNSIVNYPANTSAILLYSQGRRRCDEPTLDSRFSLSCPPSNPFYTRYAFAIAASGPNNISGVCYDGQVFEVAPAGVDCRQYYNEPPNQPTEFMRTISIAIATTRVYAAMPYTPINPSAVMPFTFAQFQTADPLNWCSNNTGSCTLATIESAPQNAVSCTSKDLELDFGIFPNSTEILDHCGPYTDPPGDFIPTTSCQMACCAPCNNETTNSSFVRPFTGPYCTFNRLGPVQYLIYGGVRAGFANEPPGKDSVRFQQRLFTADGLPYFVGGLTSTTPIFINNSRHMRVSVGAVNSPSPFPPGYLIVCDLQPAEPEDQGPGNPYITGKIPSPCLQEISPDLVDNAPLVAPPNANPSTMGAGTVPTATGLGSGARASFFYVSEEKVGQLLENYPSATGMFLQDYLAQLFNGADAIDPSTSQTTCPGAASTYFSQFVGVPGWELDPATMEPLVMTVCQMSNEINYYAYKFMQYYNSTGDWDLARIMADEDPGFPDSLLPWWNIVKPGAWLHGNRLITDIGLLVGQKNAGELFVDLVDSEYRQNTNNQYNFAIVQEQSGCFTWVSNGTGALGVTVGQFVDSTETVRVQVSCQTIYNGSVTITYDGVTNFTNTGIIVGPAPGYGQILELGFYNMSFAGNSSAVFDTYVTCNLVMVDEIGQPYGPTILSDCVRLDTYSTIASNAMQVLPVDQEDDGIPSWAFWTFIVVVIVIMIFAIVFVVGIVMISNKKKKQKMS